MITDYSHLPLGAYLDILAIDEDEGLQDIERQAAVIAILNGKSTKDILNLPIDAYAMLSASLGFLLSAVPEVPLRKERTITLEGGGTYTLPRDAQHITTAQFADFQHYAGEWGEGGHRPVAQLLSCLLVPVSHRYLDGYEIAGVQEDILQHLDTVRAFSLCAFFLTLCRESFEHILDFSERTMLKRVPEERRGTLPQRIAEARALLATSGGGSIVYSALRLPPICRGLKSGEWKYSKRSTSSPISRTRKPRSARLSTDGSKSTDA